MLKRRIALAVPLVALSIVQAIAAAPASAGSTLNVLSLGDSYSAGVGLGSVTAGCDRNRGAYAIRAAKQILKNTHPLAYLGQGACSGAKSQDVMSNQVRFVNSSTNVVAMTVGGNDIGFGPKVKGCYFGRCGPDTFSLQADVNGGTQTWDAVYGKLVSLYVSIRQRMAPNGHLYVVTYPIPFARQTSSRCQGLDPDEQNAANALVTRLDDTIYTAVDQANRQRGNVHFVEWRTGTRVNGGYSIPGGYTGAGQSFATFVTPDGLCNNQGRRPFINGYVRSTNAGNSFHPNSTGYWNGAVALATAVNAFQP
jgi:lysophospholipase L1-like esterase